MASTALPSRVPIFEAATALVESYGRAMAFSNPPTSKYHAITSMIGSSLAAHYGRTTRFFVLGSIMDLGNPETANEAIAQHIGRFKKAGVGVNIRLEKSRVDIVSPNNALCWLTWRIEPREGSGVEGWAWENVYGYRRYPIGTDQEAVKMVGAGDAQWKKPEGWFEASLCDNEVLGMLQRFPTIMDD